MTRRLALPLALLALGCSGKSKGDEAPSNAPDFAIEVLGLEAAGKLVCVDGTSGAVEFRVKNVGKKPVEYAVQAPTPIYGEATAFLSPGDSSGPISVADPWTPPDRDAKTPPIVVNAGGGTSKSFPVELGLDPRQLRSGIEASDVFSSAVVSLVNPTRAPFVGTVEAPVGFTLEGGSWLVIPPRSRTVLRMSLDHVVEGRGEAVGGDLVVRSSTCGPDRILRVPVQVHQLNRAVQVAAGDGHSCLVDVSGAVFCWGDGALGQLGTAIGGATHPRIVPALASGVTALRAGRRHTCALKGKRVLCWGDGSRGQVGGGVVPSRSEPQEVPGLGDVIAFAAGGDSSCAVRPDGHVLCWGAEVRPSKQFNSSGIAIVPPTDLFGVSDARDVAIGRGHACFLRQDGTVACWGVGTQVGAGVADDTEVPVAVVGLTGATALLGGNAHTCATTSGGFACWGEGYMGQVDGAWTTSAALSPRPHAGGKLLCVGADTTCFLSDGSSSPTCWGKASGSTSMPTGAAACGGGHVCFVRSDAGTPSITCTGTNDQGQAPARLDGF